MSSSEDSTSKLLRSVQTSSAQLLRSCTKLGESLPSTPGIALGSGKENGEWPELLGYFKNISAQLVELGGRGEMQQLEHVVPVPMNPGALPDGRPTMLVPNLLRTKLPPEQEAELTQVRSQIAPFLPEESLEKEEREHVAMQRSNEMRMVINWYNRDMDHVIKSFVENPGRIALKRKCADTVNRFHSKKTPGRVPEGTDLLVLMYTGAMKSTLTELVEEVNTQVKVENTEQTNVPS